VKFATRRNPAASSISAASRPMARCAAVIGLVFFIFCGSVLADLYSHKYKDGDPVIVWVNKVGPFQNPQEAYAYYDLPFCTPEKHIETAEGLGEALQGYELVQSDIVIPFKVNVPPTQTCQKTLDAGQAKLFSKAIKKNYWYQLFFDDLPIWGRVGEAFEEEQNGKVNVKVFLYTHKKFAITYNNNRVIEVNLTTENPILVEPGVTATFTFSATWFPTNVPFDKRFDKYLDETFFEHQIHWFSIFNSFMMVIFLVGLVAMILMRTLRKDFASYPKDEDESSELGDLAEDSGWKQVRGDVFRPPPNLLLFSVLIGSGYQLAFLSFFVIALALIADLYEERGQLLTAFIICYSLTAFIGGYASGGYYARNGGKSWIKALVVSALFFPGICFGIITGLNMVAVSYHSLAYIPFGTMMTLASLWLFITCPLTLVGTILGRNWSGKPDNPCRINQIPRTIPEKKWYLQPWVHIALGGILPFGSIFIEMYFIFTSFWHYKYYYVYGFMLLVYIILIIVSVCVTIVSTYFLLNSEDYRWQWVSFLASASTAGYVFLYSIYYFVAKTKMTGFFQTAFYFGYMAMFCLGLAVMCGAIGFVGTSIFVRKIYQMKID
jgi:transmembrane 9 superfamily protein 3